MTEDLELADTLRDPVEDLILGCLSVVEECNFLVEGYYFLTVEHSFLALVFVVGQCCISYLSPSTQVSLVWAEICLFSEQENCFDG